MRMGRAHAAQVGQHAREALGVGDARSGARAGRRRPGWPPPPARSAARSRPRPAAGGGRAARRRRKRWRPASWSCLFLEGEGGLLERAGERKRRGRDRADGRVTRAVHDRRPGRTASPTVTKKKRSQPRRVVELEGVVQQHRPPALQRRRAPALPRQVKRHVPAPVEGKDHAEAAAGGPVAEADEVSRPGQVAVGERLAAVRRLAEEGQRRLQPLQARSVPPRRPVAPGSRPASRARRGPSIEATASRRGERDRARPASGRPARGGAERAPARRGADALRQPPGPDRGGGSPGRTEPAPRASSRGPRRPARRRSSASASAGGSSPSRCRSSTTSGTVGSSSLSAHGFSMSMRSARSRRRRRRTPETERPTIVGHLLERQAVEVVQHRDRPARLRVPPEEADQPKARLAARSRLLGAGDAHQPLFFGRLRAAAGGRGCG